MVPKPLSSTPFGVALSLHGNKQLQKLSSYIIVIKWVTSKNFAGHLKYNPTRIVLESISNKKFFLNLQI
jgi:hypothetical protein